MKNEIHHPFLPLYNAKSRVLILGSFPSVKSRENSFYYGHPQNRFWKTISAMLTLPVPQSIEDKKSMLLENGIALWDVIESCEIKGSSDSSIKNVVPNNIESIINTTEIKAIFCNGTKAFQLYKKHIATIVNVKVFCLPSTSPANAGCSQQKLTETYSAAILPYLNLKH